MKTGPNNAGSIPAVSTTEQKKGPPSFTGRPFFLFDARAAATDSVSGPAGRGAEQGIVAACGDPA